MRQDNFARLLTNLANRKVLDTSMFDDRYNIPPDQLSKIVQALKQHPDITKLAMPSANIDASSLKQIVDGFGEQGATKLKTIILSNNVLGQQGVQLLEDLMGRSPDLEELKLGHNSLAPSDIKKIMQYIEGNPDKFTRLRTLDFSGNMAGSGVAAAALSLVQKFPSVMTLDYNFYTYETAEMAADTEVRKELTRRTQELKRGEEASRCAAALERLTLTHPELATALSQITQRLTREEYRDVLTILGQASASPLLSSEKTTAKTT